MNILKLNINRLFSTINIVKCAGCKHYNYINGNCHGYVEHDKITGNKTYLSAKYIRSRNDKCGTYKKLMYVPILEELQNTYKINKIKLVGHKTMATTTVLSSLIFMTGSLLIDVKFSSVAFPLLFMTIQIQEKIKKIKKENDEIRMRIDDINFRKE